MNRIKKLTQVIRDNSENELCYGTLRTLKMIEDESENIGRLQLENEQLKKVIKGIFVFQEIYDIYNKHTINGKNLKIIKQILEENYDSI